MPRPILVEDLAEDDIREAIAYYDRQREGLGLEFYDDLLAAFERLQRHPIGAVRARGSTEAQPVYALHLSRFPFELVFLDEPATIQVIAVAHFKRQPGYWRTK